MGDSAIQEALALSVTTRKHMRSVPIEDPLKELERVLDYVRTHDYARAYAFLKSPARVEAPHRMKGESGAGYIVGALLLAPIWILAAPLFLAGIAKSLAPPASDERLNQKYRLALIDNLTKLRHRVKAELVADAANAEKLEAQLATYGLQNLKRIHSQAIKKEWDSIHVAPAGRAIKRRNGWHLLEMGDLHVGALNASFYGTDGEVLDLPLRSVSSITVVRRCIAVLSLSRPKGKQVGLFLPNRILVTVAHLDDAKSRVARTESTVRRRVSVRSAANSATKSMQSLLRPRSQKSAKNPPTSEG